MRRILAACFSGFLCLTSMTLSASAAMVPPESRTLFYYAEKSWAVGTISLVKPLPFRDGRILVFPSQITDLLWAPDGTKPRSLMLVYEVPSNEKDKPFLQAGDKIFAPIRLLPDHSYWKDNLPNTRRHEIAGGKRYAFRGEEAAEVRALLATYLAATEIKGLERWSAQLDAVSVGLASKIAVVREDSVRYFTVFPSLGRDFKERTVAPVAAYLSGDAPAEEKSMLVNAFVAAKAEAIYPTLVELGKRDDAVGAVAMDGLDQVGQGPSTERLLTLSRSALPEMQAYTAGALGRRSATDEAALRRSMEILTEPTSTPAVRDALISGLARAGGDKVVAALAEVVARGDSSSRTAAEALGRLGGPAAEAALTKILTEGTGEAALAAVAGLGHMSNCRGCAGVLHEQHDKHADPAVRKLIEVVLGVPLEHKH